MDKHIVSQINNSSAQLLDVRTQKEWDSSHAAYAVHIPLPELNSKTLTILNIDKPIFVYCQSGNRAGQAMNVLKKIGYDAHNIGGLSDWQAAGGELVS
jgi:phage shock protein E